MKRFSNFICEKKNFIVVVSIILLLFSVIGMKLTKINYDILVYLPDDIETIRGQNVLTDDFNMGAYSITIIDNMSSKDILKLEDEIKKIDGVAKVGSIYDVIGTNIPIEMLPNEISSKVHNNSDLLLITFDSSTSSEKTIDAVKQIRNITDNRVNQGGMSSMVLDTMELSEKEIMIYIVIAVLLCIVVLELSLDSYIVPILLLANIGFAILFNLGTNIFFGQISYITKALVAVLQLGVTTDFSIFLYHSYEKKKGIYKTKENAMVEAISDTFKTVTGSSLTTIVGFLALCAMQLTLGRDLGIVMAKGVLLGVITVLTVFPSLLLLFDNLIEKTKHSKVMPNFNRLNKFIVKFHIPLFILFILLIVPMYLANSKVAVYYKLDSSLPNTLESVRTNKQLKEQYNIVSPEIILVDKNLKNDSIINMINEIKNVNGIDFVLSFAQIKNLGITEEMLNSDITSMFENEQYQIILVNSLYDIATDELNEQVGTINEIVKKYDNNAIVAGEGPLMKDLVSISNTDFNNVNTYSIICIFIVLFFVLKSISLPILLITVIEFAIFTNMGISYFSGTTLPFIAPIVLGTIQLGATIDYAILMTTNYLEKRKNNIPKKEAMVEVLNYCGSSILVSGMCFFASTFGVGLYSKIEMIGTLCTLISRGAIISMLVVISVLPATLLIFDKLILKTTLKEEKNMKKIIKNSVASILILGLLTPNMTLALTKNETVYSKLNYDGSIKTTLVNEQIINNDKLDTIEDYTLLNNILNVSNDNSYILDNNKITWNANKKDIFYQGTTNQKLPISLNVTYKLDGKTLELDEMLGKSGNATITLKYINNEKHGNLYTPFVVTSIITLDNEKSSNIEINNGKIVNNGNKSAVVGIASPGLYESLNLNELKGLDTITINFDTTEFELPAIYSLMTPKLLETSDLEVFTKLDEIYDKTDKLQENMNLLTKGADSLKNGSNTIKNKLKAAIDSLDNHKDALTQEQISLIKKQAQDSIKNIYTDKYKEEIGNTAWKEVKKQLENSNNSTITTYVKEAVEDSINTYLQSAYETDYNKCLQGKIKVSNGNSMSNEEQYSCGVVNNATNNDSTLLLIKQITLKETSSIANKTTYYIAENISKSVASNVSLKTALQVASDVSSKTAINVSNSVKKKTLEIVKNSLTILYNGIDELDNGIDKLSVNLTKFNNEGINKITKFINSDLKNTTDKIEELTKLSENYSSFASNDTNTKFIFVIDSKKVKNEVIKTNNIEVNETFWTRVKNLFK